MPRELEGRVALVSGGGSGIGQATVTALITAGARVAFTDIKTSAVHEALFIHADATLEHDAARSVADTVAAFGRLDIVVNNVGNFGEGDRWDVTIAETPLAAWEATLRQCLTTTMLGMKFGIPALIAGGGGAIVNIASLAGIRVTPYSSPAYTAAKAGVVHLSEQAAVMLAKQNIRVNVVAPGLTLTPNIEASMPAETRIAIAGEFHPMGRMVTPEEVADAIVWAASPRSSGVTGLTIPVDGGWAAK